MRISYSSCSASRIFSRVQSVKRSPSLFTLPCLFMVSMPPPFPIPAMFAPSEKRPPRRPTLHEHYRSYACDGTHRGYRTRRSHGTGGYELPPTTNTISFDVSTPIGVIASPTKIPPSGVRLRATTSGCAPWFQLQPVLRRILPKL